MQWVIGHLTIPASIEFFRRCAAGLRPPPTTDSDSEEFTRRSIIVLKDNVTSRRTADFDDVDSSFMRTRRELLGIFREAGLRVLLDEKQKNMPAGLCPIYAFVLVPL